MVKVAYLLYVEYRTRSPRPPRFLTPALDRIVARRMAERLR